MDMKAALANAQTALTEKLGITENDAHELIFAARELRALNLQCQRLSTAKGNLMVLFRARQQARDVGDRLMGILRRYHYTVLVDRENHHWLITAPSTVEHIEDCPYMKAFREWAAAQPKGQGDFLFYTREVAFNKTAFILS